MSSLDQPLLIANSNYHVGQQMSIRVAEEQGYFRDEGLAAYEYDWNGMHSTGRILAPNAQARTTTHERSSSGRGN